MGEKQQQAFNGIKVILIDATAVAQLDTDGTQNSIFNLQLIHISYPIPIFVCLFLGVGKNFRLLMQSCCFFVKILFKKISNFSKTVHTIFTKICTVILHPKRQLRVQRRQNRMAWM